jgi:hypothetical protein
LLLSGGLLKRDVPTLTLHGINGDSAGNYNLIDEESTGGMIIPAGNCQLTDEESTGGLGSCEVLTVHRRGIHWRKGIPQGIASSFTLIQTGKIKVRGKSSKR